MKNVMLVLTISLMVSAVQAGVITPTGVASSSAWDDSARKPGNTIDGVGMTWDTPLEASTHDSESDNFWHANEPMADVWIEFDLGTEMDLETMIVWNLHPRQAYAGERTRGIQQYDLVLEAADRTVLATFNDLVLQMAADQQYAPGEVVDFADTAGVQYVRIEVDSNYDGSPYTGLSEVRFTGVPEPATMVLFGLGCLMGIRRRK